MLERNESNRLEWSPSTVYVKHFYAVASFHDNIYFLSNDIDSIYLTVYVNKYVYLFSTRYVYLSV